MLIILVIRVFYFQFLGDCRLVGFNPEKDVWVLWEDDEVGVIVPVKTGYPAHYSGWVIVVQNQNVKTPYDDYRLYAKMSVITATVQKGLEETGLAPSARASTNQERY